MKRFTRMAFVSALAGMTIAIVQPVFADRPWPPGGIPVAPSTAEQRDPVIVSDGADGAFLFWLDARDGFYKSYALRLNKRGRTVAGWPARGIEFPESDAWEDGRVTAMADGEGGAFVVSEASWDGPLTISRITREGRLADGWPQGGIGFRPDPASNEPESPLGIYFHKFARIVPDGSGGVFVHWFHANRANDMAWLAQIGGDGTRLHWANIGFYPGIPVSACRGSGGTLFHAYELGGALRVWHRDAAQHIVPPWPDQGVQFEESLRYLATEVISDDEGGAYVLWQSDRAGVQHTWIQRLQEDGSVALSWPPNGRPVSPGASLAAGVIDSRMLGPFPATVAIEDGAGGVFAAWVDQRRVATGDLGDLHIQRITPDGDNAPGWPDEGIAISRDVGLQDGAALSADGQGGVWVAWRHHIREDWVELYVQHVDASGRRSRFMPPMGRRIGRLAGSDHWPVILGLDPANAIVAWANQGPGPAALYAYRVDTDWRAIPLDPTVGVEPGEHVALALEPASPNPAAHRLRVAFTVPRSGAATISLYDLSGRQVLDRRVMVSAGRTSIELRIGNLRPGVYTLQLEHDGATRTRRVSIVH